MQDPIAKTTPLFDARDYVARGEDPKILEALATGYCKRFRPDGPVERFMVTTMLLAQWNKDRWSRLEVSLIGSTDDLLAFITDPSSNKVLLQVQRRIDQEDRRYFRAFADLRRLQKERAASEPAAPPEENKPVTENWVRSFKQPEAPMPVPQRPANIPTAATP
ncbi:MAG: hypothetical protein ABSB88_06780 [Bryobacteraceae bacterium]|jgi:hypothetical protein